MIKTNAKIIQAARDLRKRQTCAEEKLWQFLRDRRFKNLKFRRQHPLGRFIADFYCHEAKLIIELDGFIHNLRYQKEHDRLRTKLINQYGMKVMRFGNEEIISDVEKALKEIGDDLTPKAPPLLIRRGVGGEGFTILETIMAVAIFTLMMGAVSASIVSFYRANSYTLNKSFAIDSASKGVETMVREIREATYSDTGAYPVVSAATNNFIFFSDIDKDAKIEKVRYFLDGLTFKKGEIEATGNPPVYQSGDEVLFTLSEYVRNGANPIFAYYDVLGNEIADLSRVADIALIKVKLIVNVDPNMPPDDFTLYSTAQLRNLKTNF